MWGPTFSHVMCRAHKSRSSSVFWRKEDDQTLRERVLNFSPVFRLSVFQHQMLWELDSGFCVWHVMAHLYQSSIRFVHWSCSLLGVQGDTCLLLHPLKTCPKHPPTAADFERLLLRGLTQTVTAATHKKRGKQDAEIRVDGLKSMGNPFGNEFRDPDWWNV